MKIASRIALVCILPSAALLAGEQPSEKITVTDENVFKLSTTMKRATNDPFRHGTIALSAACTYTGQTSVSGGQLAVPSAAASKAGAKSNSSASAEAYPHAVTGMHVYLNTLAEEALEKKAGAYPVGAMIVKEKLDQNGTVTGVGGMIKRAPGFDAVNADWEYFYADKGGKLAQGRIDNCANCHSEARKTDFVFARWQGNK